MRRDTRGSGIAGGCLFVALHWWWSKNVEKWSSWIVNIWHEVWPLNNKTARADPNAGYPHLPSNLNPLRLPNQDSLLWRSVEQHFFCKQFINLLRPRLILKTKEDLNIKFLVNKKIQLDATVCRHLFTAKSLYMFRASQHPSSGVLKNVTATSGIGHNTGTATSFHRVLIRPRWKEVAVAVLWPTPEVAVSF